MKTLIVAKTRQGSGACIGGITFEGQSVRLIAADAETNEYPGMEYEVGDVWEVDYRPASSVLPPHVENVIVHSKQRLPPIDDAGTFIRGHMPPHDGGIDVLYEGLTRATRAGALFIAERIGVPPYSTTFWTPDKMLKRDDDGKRIRYRYPTDDGGRTLTFVGFQEPVTHIEPGTLLRVSLAHWWRPDDMPEGELRCYVQLSGWFLPQAGSYWPGWELEQAYEVDGRPEPSPKQATSNMPAGMDTGQFILEDTFGYDGFLPLQEEVIENIIKKKDTLAIMPTGSGKSLCYQLPALMFEGLTVVVSPLISLMQDQVDQLRQLQIPAVFLNSTLSHSQYVTTAQRIRQGARLQQGAVKLLYVAPETLLRPETLVLLDECQVDCLAIDEAHCISSWGHDFRPVYRQLISVRQRWPQAVCFALTATATRRVQTDIKEALGIREANEFLASFNRENLFLEVQPKSDGWEQLLAFLEQHRDQSGIIYCATRKGVDRLAEELAAQGWSVLPYHAGMESVVRRRTQRQFSRDEVQIVVATIAFGMGIDKSNVRFIVHYNLPKDIESYYQEIGRSGRDGLRADCLLLYSYGDVGTIRRFIEEKDREQQLAASVRLQAMVDYAESSICRRRPLITYFNEVYEAENCGMCDICLREKQELVDLTIAAQKYLSCVKKTGEIFGNVHIVNVLRGSSARTILDWRHNRLSTYGIGREFTARQWAELSRQFVSQGLLARDPDHGSLKLTSKAYDVFKGEPVMGTAPGEAVKRAQRPEEDLDYDLELFSILRGRRTELARASGVPPYVIFSDRSLVEMAAYYPQSPEAFSTMYGVGWAKLEKYAGAFLPLIRAYCETKQIEEITKAGRS